jgi:hypothetical protein
MKSLRQAIEEGQKRFAKLPFFRRLEQQGSTDDARVFVPALAFFVMAFQDMLRLNEARVRDPELRALVRGHRAEDREHEQWFLRDLERLGLVVDLHWLFGPEHAQTRDSTYAVMSEIFRATDDRLRVAIVLVLESTGEVFFGRVPRYMEESDPRQRDLEYFSRMHAAVERGHAIFEDKMRDLLDAIDLPRGLQRQAVAMINRMYAAMTEMVEGFEARIQEAADERAHRPRESWPPELTR